MSRKPDVSLTLRGPKAEWKTHCADAQLKSRTKDRNEATAQLYDGALNTLAVQDERRFHIGIAFLGHLGQGQTKLGNDRGEDMGIEGLWPRGIWRVGEGLGLELSLELEREVYGCRTV